MRAKIIFSLALIAGWLGLPPHVHSQVVSTRTLYRINSGSYVMRGGIWGTLGTRLPNANQAYLLLTTEEQNGRATMSFLGENQQTPFLTLSNGWMAGSTIRFQYPLNHPYPGINEMGMLDYVVLTGDGDLKVNGNMRFLTPCCDIPDYFGHTNVVASAIPALAIRVSEVELSWQGTSNRTYQVQFRSEQTTNQWVNLGPPVMGSVLTNSVFDRILPGQAQRLYRVLTLP